MQLAQRGKKVHLVGIGGIGLSAIARVLQGWGFQVSGSDLQLSALTDSLAQEGITIRSGHQAEWVLGADFVIVSSAVPEDNPEVQEAHRLGLPVLRREQVLSELTTGMSTIAVAGTHGKTTTSSMIAWILKEAGLDPTFVVGGILQNLGTNAGSGAGPHFVIEADEYDRAFLGLRPSVAVITALEHDHPDCYPTFPEMRDAFIQFADQVLPGGLLIVCGEDAEAYQLASSIQASGRRVETYGLKRKWNWWAQGAQLGNSAAFEVWSRTEIPGGPHTTNRSRLGTCALQVPGLHNVLNSLAALAASAEAGVEFGTAAAALTRFRGTARRFEIKGQRAGITVVDDYAHHPTEIRATLAAAQIKYPGREIWAVFQPHTFSRTATLLAGFATAFGDAAHVVITDIYPAREEDTLGVSGVDIVKRMDHPDVRYSGTMDEAVKILLDQLQVGDVVITLGAGDGYLIGERLLEHLNSHERDA